MLVLPPSPKPARRAPLRIVAVTPAATMRRPASAYRDLDSPRSAPPRGWGRLQGDARSSMSVEWISADTHAVSAMPAHDRGSVLLSLKNLPNDCVQRGIKNPSIRGGMQKRPTPGAYVAHQVSRLASSTWKPSALRAGPLYVRPLHGYWIAGIFFRVPRRLPPQSAFALAIHLKTVYHMPGRVRRPQWKWGVIHLARHQGQRGALSRPKHRGSIRQRRSRVSHARHGGVMGRPPALGRPL